LWSMTRRPESTHTRSSHKVPLKEGDMAANAYVILEEWERILKSWDHALGYAPGMDDLKMSDYSQLQEDTDRILKTVCKIKNQLKPSGIPTEAIPFPELYK